jgi:UDP-N-acetylglucosamine 4-epimerase
VYASSSSVYGDDVSDPKVEEIVGEPLSPYAASKRTGELYAATFARTHGIDSVGLRYFNVFGPRQDPRGPYAAVIPRWIGQLFSGQPCVVYGDGSASRDFCYVANVVQANLLAASAPGPQAAPRIFNVACGKSTTLLELFSTIRRQIATVWPSAGDKTPHFEPPRPGDVLHSRASVDRARGYLGYVPEYDLGRGLEETVRWTIDRSARRAVSRAGTSDASHSSRFS